MVVNVRMMVKIQCLWAMTCVNKYSVWVLRYVQHFPEMKHAIKSRQDHNLSQSKASTSCASFAGDAEGHVLVGFGPYKHMSHFDLSNSPQDEHKKYVRRILQLTVTHPGGQMDKLKSYIQTQQSLAEEKADDESLVQLVDQLEQRVVGLQSSARVSTEDLRVPPPPPPLPDVTAPVVHSEVPSALEKVIRLLIFTMSYNHAELLMQKISYTQKCAGGINPLQLGTNHALIV